jgi:hypothetical protein
MAFLILENLNKKIKFYNKNSPNNCLGITDKAFDMVRKRELMRGHTLDFSIAIDNPCSRFAVQGAIFEITGLPDSGVLGITVDQRYDISRMVSDTGSNNVINISAEHVSYRLNNYLIDVGYTSTGSIDMIITDILNVSGANAEFTTIGSPTAGGFFTYTGTTQISVRSLLLKLASYFGFEFYFNNFQINAVAQISYQRFPPDPVFSFGNNLVNLRSTTDYTQGSPVISCDVDIVNLQRNYPPNVMTEDSFDVGDFITINGSTPFITRVVSYDFYFDNPIQDKIITGTFLKDLSDIALAGGN